LGYNGIEEIMEHDFFKNLDWEAVADKQLVPPFIPKVKGVNDLNQICSSVVNVENQAESDENVLTYSEKRNRHLSEFSYLSGDIVHNVGQINQFSNSTATEHN
jgi:hypothetical protein